LTKFLTRKDVLSSSLFFIHIVDHSICTKMDKLAFHIRIMFDLGGTCMNCCNSISPLWIA